MTLRHVDRRSFLRALALSLGSLGLSRSALASAAGHGLRSAAPATDPAGEIDLLACSIQTRSPFTDAAASGYDRVVKGRVHGFTVPRGERWRVKGLVKSDKNVIVKGTLVMRPGDTLRFIDVKERGFAGGGMDPMASDVGLWVMGSGRLDAVGTPKLGWARATGSIAQGETSITLDAVPFGWRAGDRIIVTPTTPYVSDRYADPANQYWNTYEDTRIRAVNGSTIELTTPTAWAHPSCDLPDGRVMTAEVANLTRNVRIQGTPTGRTHIFIRSSVPQFIQYVEMAHLSPLKRDDFVLGRWGLHFHHCHNGSRGSLIEGCTMHDIGGRGIVPHASHGTTWRDIVVHDAQIGEAFWWDEEVEKDNSSDTVWDHCLASKVGRSGFRLTGGVRNLVRDSVAVGGVVNSSGGGFLWAGGLPGASGFRAEDCVSHNNRAQGVRVWQNGKELSSIDGFVSYRNESAGVGGAYGVTMSYRRLVTVENATPWSFHSLSSIYDDCVFDGAGGPFAAHTGKHSVSGQDNVLTNCHFGNYTAAGLHFNAEPSAHGEKFQMIDCTFDGNEFWMEPTVPAESYAHVVDAIRGDVTLLRIDQTGIPYPAWNAVASL